MSKEDVTILTRVIIGVVIIFLCFTAWLFGYWNFKTTTKMKELDVAEKLLDTEDVSYERKPFTERWEIELGEE